MTAGSWVRIIHISQIARKEPLILESLWLEVTVSSINNRLDNEYDSSEYKVHVELVTSNIYSYLFIGLFNWLNLDIKT